MGFDSRDILTSLYGVWKEPNEIQWESLPHRFAIKCNHGSGYNLICTDISKFDCEKSTKILKNWLNERYGRQYVEQGIYNRIPRRIIAEEYIETKDDKPPKDYKFFCSFGKCKFLFVACDRYDDQTKYDFYYPDWTYIPVKIQFPNNGFIEKPKLLDDMIRYAEKLSEPFPLVRVDFYNEGTRIIFGEMTFSNFGGLMPFYPDHFDKDFGKLFPDIDILKKWKFSF